MPPLKLPLIGLCALVVLGVTFSTLRSEFAESPRTWPEKSDFVPIMGDLRTSFGKPLLFSMDGDAGPGVRFHMEFEFHWPSGTEGRFGGWRMDDVEPDLPIGAESRVEGGAGDKGL